jgi:hypothetical protein
MFVIKRLFFIAIIILGCIILGVVLFLKNRDNNPLTNADYTRVVQLVEGKQLLPTRADIRTVLLPAQYQYLTASGSIGLDMRITTVIFFSSGGDHTGQGYLYKANNQSPTGNDFPPLPYPDSFICERLQPRWFSCHYTWH